MEEDFYKQASKKELIEVRHSLAFDVIHTNSRQEFYRLFSVLKRLDNDLEKRGCDTEKTFKKDKQKLEDSIIKWSIK